MTAPSIDNIFLIEGRECFCDGDASCDNHDSNAEVAYWFGIFSKPIPVLEITTERADRVYEGQEHKYADYELA